MKIEPTLSWKENAPASRTPSANVLAFVNSEEGRTELLASLAALENIAVQAHIRGSGDDLALLQEDRRPNLILADIDTTVQEDLDFLKRLKAASPGLPIIVVTERSSDTAGVKAFRAGADDVLFKPLDIQETKDIFLRFARDWRLLSGADAKLGGAIAFMHVTGGAGATTLAINTASLLAEHAKDGETCLIDFDIQYGNVASLLDLQNLSPIAELIDDPGRLDREMLENMVVLHTNGVKVLTAPKHPFPLNAYSSETVGKILDIAKKRFAHVVIDLPVALTSWTDIVLKEAELVYLVCNPNVASVHRLAQFMWLLEQEELNQLPIRIVLNRNNFVARSGDISVGQFEGAVGRSVSHVIPNDYALVSQSHSEGRPAINLKPNSKFAESVASLVEQDLHIQTGVRKGLFQRVLGRT
ncbi:MAG TPA: response regulator [Rhizomicrobium sp.]|jgi:pilus assembly protein CpaE|nr:response regulator [Rhizomicrobium sp.]